MPIIRPIPPPNKPPSPEESSSAARAEARSFSPDLSSRLESPRILLWASPSYVLEESLAKDLPLLGPRLLAVYGESDGVTRAFASALRDLRGRQLVTLTGPRDLEAWKSDDLSLVALPPRDAGDSRRRRIREKLLDDTLKRYLAERPFVIALGFGGSDEDLRALLEAIGDYDETTPIILLGSPEPLAAAVERIAVDYKPHVATGWADWDAFRSAAESARYSLLTSEGPLVLVGDTRVALADVFDDPSLRLDGTWRVITTRAATPPPPGTDVRDMFRAFMDLNERRDARSAEEDCLEWWAHLEQFPLARPLVEQCTTAVLTELAGLKVGEYKRPRICWLPAEAGAGATAVLHGVALQVARHGYPVLVLKQEARDVDIDQVKDYLISLRDLSAHGRNDQDADRTEHPALLVLDAQHAGLEHVEMLPEYLTRRHGRRVLTVWACNVAPEIGAPSAKVPPWDWFSDRFVGLKDLRPRNGDVFLPVLRASVGSAEVHSLRDHVEDLKAKRRLDLPERSEATWQQFQKHQGFEVEALVRTTDLEDEAKLQLRREFEAESLFWVLLYHFLTNRDVDPVRAALRTRVATIMAGSLRGTDADLVFALLVEIAKASAWGLVVPESALIDWHVHRQARMANSTEAGASIAEAGTITAAEAARRLSSWARGGRAAEPIDPAAPVRRALDGLEEKGWIRRHTIGRSVMVRFPHRTLARAFLLVALEQHPEKVTTKDARSILLLEWAFEGFRHSLAALRPTDANIQYCEQLSEALLVGDDHWEGWKDRRGSDRLTVYRSMPAEVRERSRVLMHHYAIVLRRSTFSRDMDPAERRKRLEEAHEQLNRALEMPWRRGVRDEHPAFIRTTLGLVFNSLSHAVADRGASLGWLDQATSALREALIDVPASRHTRLALAQVLLEEARRYGRGPQAVGLVAEGLQLVSVEPTGNEKRWYQTRADLAGFFSEESGRRLVQELKQKGIEDGFLLDAELRLVPASDPLTLDHSRREALTILREALAGEDAVKRPRTARRAADLMAFLEDEALRHEERYRLLTLAESRTPLTAAEEFQLAWLAFVLGRYSDGLRRFDGLRASQRANEVSDEVWLVAKGQVEPRRLEAAVERIEGDRGWMVVRDEAGDRLFRAPFVARHFSRSGAFPRHGQTEPVLVRFTGMGPRAVPLRFGFDQKRSSASVSRTSRS